MKRSLLMICLYSLTAVLSAGTFSSNGGKGTSIIDAAGGTADYTSLAQAAEDFSSYGPGCTGDWTLLVRSNLTEPNNVAFGNSTNGYLVTIKPAPSTTPVITFTTTTRPAAGVWDAALCIGTSTSLSANVDYPTTTSNFTIDGSNAVSGSSRDMTLRTTSAMETVSILCRVVCGSDNVAFKNLIVDNQSSGTSTNDVICIEYTSRRANGLDYHPSNGTVTNCLLRAKGALNGVGIMCRTSGTIGAGAAQSGMSFTSNTIEVTCQGINASMNANTAISNNTLDVFQSLTHPTNVANGRPTGMNHAANLTSGWNVAVTNNKFLRYGNVNYPFVLPQLVVGGGIVSPGVGTYDISNNFFGGFDYTGVTTVTSQQSLRSIQIMGTSGTLIAGTYNIYHNSFNNPDIPFINGAGTTRGYDRLVPLSISSPSFAGTVNFKNNIVRFEQHNGVVFYLVSPNSITFNSDYNVYYLGTAGAKMATWNVASATAPVTHATFASWQAAGFDAHSRIANPTVAFPPGTGKWISNSDLHFDADASFLFEGTPVGIATDIDGQPRTTPIIGADETALSQVSAARDWSIYQ